MATVSIPGGFPWKGLGPWAHVCDSEAGWDLRDTLAACSGGTKTGKCSFSGGEKEERALLGRGRADRDFSIPAP